MRIKSSGDFSKITDPDEFQRQISIIMQDAVSALNGNIEFDLNIRSQTVQVKFASANTQVTVGHNLARVPTGYFQVGSNAATSIYSTQDSDAGNVYLKSSAIATVQVVVF